MQKTSANYNPFPQVREVDCRISFGVIAREASEGEISGNDAGFFPRYAQTADGIEEIGGKWASLEQNFWRLDGTYDLAPDDMDGVQTGWWSSSVSGADGRFAEPPYIQYMFGDEFASLGWTLYFDNAAQQYPTDVTVELLAQDGTVLETLSYTGTSAVQTHRYTGGIFYYGVRFTFLATSEPFRRVRLVESKMGIVKYYDRDTLGSAEFIYGASPDASTLPSRELQFTFDNSQKEFNLLVPDEAFRHLREGQQLNAQIVVGGEKIEMGEFYFASADASRSVVAPEITAYDRIYALDAYQFNDGRDEQTTLEAAVAEVIAVTGLDIPVAFGDGVGSRPVHMSIRPETSVREALRQLAQAARCTPYIGRDSVLRFEELSVGETADGTLTADELHDYSGVGISEQIFGVRLTVADEFRTGVDGTSGRQVYFYSGDEGRAVGYANPCVADSEGQAVADWLLRMANMTRRYKVRNRCDPAVEIGDTLNIADAYGNRENAVVTGLDITFGSSLSAVTEAVGE